VPPLPRGIAPFRRKSPAPRESSIFVFHNLHNLSFSVIHSFLFVFSQVLFSGVERHHRVQSEVLDCRLHRKVAVLCKVLAVATPRQIPKLLSLPGSSTWIAVNPNLY
jgi:hypothetical protein